MGKNYQTPPRQVDAMIIGGGMAFTFIKARIRTPLLQVWGGLPNVRVFKPFATRLKPWYFVDFVRCFYLYLKVALNALQGKKSQAVSDKASCGRGHVALGNVICDL